MKVVVGLGNPGEKYAKNRHNVGFMAVDELFSSIKRDSAKTTDWESKFESFLVRAGEVLLVKPQTFMNRSGEAVAAIVNFYKVDINDLVVVHDDLDIRLGEYKLVKGVGPKIHNGLNSIEEKLASKDFYRLRIGVDNRQAGVGRTAGDVYVLDDFLPDEKDVVDGVIKKAVADLISFLNED